MGPMEAMTSSPRIVGRYAVFDAIASGGMATVHLGRLLGPAGFSRTVAIKRLHEHFARDPEFVAMFLDEARLVARIRHPNVVPTVDVVARDQELLLVMEYVSGESLSLLLNRARLGGKPIPIPVVVDIMVSVLRGLHAAHEATNEKGEPLNIVHRDVSPQNILVGTDGIARVVDFGVAKAIGRMQQTRDGQLKGKIRYMPPEQIMGRAVTRAADVYAASIVLWEALTGERMFKEGTDAEIMYQVLEGNVRPPSELRSDVSAALDEIVLCGLRKHPLDRHPTAHAMANALENVVPPVTRTAVAEWVLESARQDIEEKSQRVARVESESSNFGPLPSLEQGGPVTVTAARELSSMTPSPTSSSVLSSETFLKMPEFRTRRRVIGAGAAVVLLAIVGCVVSLRRSPSVPTAAAAAPSTSASLHAVATAAVSTTREGEPLPPAMDIATVQVPVIATPSAEPVIATAAPTTPASPAVASTSAKGARAVPPPPRVSPPAARKPDRIYRRD